MGLGPFFGYISPMTKFPPTMFIKRPIPLRALLLPSLLLALAPACSQTRLEFPETEIDEDAVDDLIQIHGEFCASPATNIAYPVKIMFVVDGSGSQQFADQNRQRVVAVEQTINALIGLPNVYFKTVVFNASITATPSPTAASAFTNDLGTLSAGLNTLAEADTLTDYQGALGMAYSEIVRDILSVSEDPARGQAELGRTKYVVILISDGLPDPQCQAGLCNDTDPNFPADPDCGGQQTNLLCENQGFIDCLTKALNPDGSDRFDCDGTVCRDTVPGSDLSCFDQGPDAQSSLFGGAVSTELKGGNDYNQPYQILQKVADLMELQEQFEVAEIRVHSGLVLDPLADPAVIEVFGDSAQAIPLMQQVAEIGEGQYLEFYGGDSINFVSVNFDAIKQQRVIRGFYASNDNAMVSNTGLIADTDADGLTDEEEFKVGSNTLLHDTDGDGFRDSIEWKRRGLGYDFDDPCYPIPDGGALCDPNCQTSAGGFADDDRDGLHNCEEAAIGTSPRNADTDGDGVPDELEWNYGLDPLRWDFNSDSDQDGIPNGQEIAWHLHPFIEQDDIQSRDRYRYKRDAVEVGEDGRECFTFDAKRIRLLTTGDAEYLPDLWQERVVAQDGLVTYDLLGGVGTNEIRLYIAENLSDNLEAPPLYRTACIRTRYVPPALKHPADGAIGLTEEDFHYIDGPDPYLVDPTATFSWFDEDQHCLTACSSWQDCGCESCTDGICRDVDWQCCYSEDCGGGNECVEHRCRPTCTRDSDCGDGNECHQGNCWPICTTDRDCPGTQECDAGLCRQYPLE